LSVEKREAIVERLAARIESWGLQSPAVLLLEANKPFSFLGSQALLLCQPLLRAFGQDDTASEWAEALEDRSTVEQIIRRLEAGPREIRA
jgi:hypothetical protein